MIKALIYILFSGIVFAEPAPDPAAALSTHMTGVLAEAGNRFIYDVRRAWMRIPEAEISEYDDVLRRVGAREGVDWRLLSAIAYHESRFLHNVVSPKGARGIMQVRPVVARHFNVPTSLITDVETNVMLAAKLLRTVEDGLGLPPGVPRRDRMSLVLACYNAGDGRVATARRRVRDAGGDANSWSDVSRYLNRRQTNAFVRQVIAQYSDYCLLASL